MVTSADQQAMVRPSVGRVTTAVRDFRRVMSSTAFTSGWLGAGDDAIESGQYDVLDRLVERDGWRMGELAAALHVDPSAVTRAVAPLEGFGFAVKERDASDRRCVVVRATDAGRVRHARARSGGLALWADALGRFEDDELTQLAVLIERLTQSFEVLMAGGAATDHGPDEPPPSRRWTGSDHRGDLLSRLTAVEARLDELSAPAGGESRERAASSS